MTDGLDQVSTAKTYLKSANLHIFIWNPVIVIIIFISVLLKKINYIF